MEINRVYILIFLVFIALTSCQKELTAEEYLAYVNNPENGLKKEKEIGDFKIGVKYEPTQFLLSKQENVEEDELSNYEHFQFRMKLKRGGDILLYKESNDMNEVTRINHFGFEAKNDFFIVSNSDTTNCIISHFSRNYNLNPTIDLTLAFNAIDKKNDWQFVYNDHQFNIGTVKFVFKKEDLSNLPILKR